MGFLDEEELPKKKDVPLPRNLERLSIDELREHIAWLQAEITRAEDDIKRKKAATSAADTFFKP